MTKVLVKKARVYVNPMCSKSRDTLAILRSKGFEVEEIRYLETPPSAQELGQICGLLDCQPTDIIRSQEVLFQAMGLNLEDQRDHQAWYEILSKHPKLIQRPIVIINNRAVIARPAERVKDLF